MPAHVGNSSEALMVIQRMFFFFHNMFENSRTEKKLRESQDPILVWDIKTLICYIY